MTHILVLPLFIFAIAAHAERSDVVGGDGDTSAARFSLASSPPLMTAPEIQCVISKVTRDEDLAQVTGQALAEALEKIRFDQREVNKTCFLHFLAQIQAESAFGKNLIQLGSQPPAKKGFGYIQVTGPENLRAVSACMDKYSPPSGNGVQSNPAATLGREPFKAALASLCWWEMNIGNNELHSSICSQPTDDSSQKITEIVNTGHIGGQVTNGYQNISNRQTAFMDILDKERACRQTSI